ncbi:MAG: PAS domain S-box protein [Opitutaceae bacterium]
MAFPTPAQSDLRVNGSSKRAPKIAAETSPAPTATEHEALLQLTQALFCSVTFSGCIRSVSQTWCDKLGVGHDEAIGEHFLSFVHEDDAEFCQEEFQRLLTGNPPRDNAVRLNCRDGSVRWMNLKAGVNREHEVIHILATDITVDRCSKHALPDPTLILDQVGQGVVVVDAGQPGMPIAYANLGFERLTGYLRNEAKGKPFHFLTGPRSDPATLETIQNAMSRGESLTEEILHYRKDGSEFWDQLILSPVIDNRGRITHFIAVLEDFTGRRLVTEALRENNQSLNDALRDLKKTKEVVIQRERLHALGQMASGIAHDFNNLLAPIVGFSELLITMPEYLRDEDRARGYLEKIRKSAQEGAAVVSRMREFYRKRDDEEDLVPVDMAEVAREAINLTAHHWRNQAEARGLRIKVDSRIDAVSRVLGSGSDLRQAITNLILNSVDAMPSDGRITVVCRERDDWVTLEVEDTGSGMDEETRRQCLEPFFTTKGQAGTGLGLAIVFGIVQRHRGRMEVDSAPGRGTRISLELPVCRQLHIQSKDTQNQAKADAMDILLIDDESLLLEAVSEHLMNMGHRASCHVDPSKALECLYKEDFDLVITDRAMPGMTGDQLARAVKEFRPDLPVVLLTGFGDIILQTGEQPENIDLVLSKPVSVNTIRNTLARFARDQSPSMTTPSLR